MAEFSAVILRLCRAQVDYSTRQIAVIVRLAEVGSDPDARVYKVLATDLAMPKASLTRSIKRLEADGMVTKDILPDDQRQYRVAMTLKARTWVATHELMPEPAAMPAWWVLTVRATDEPWMVGPFDTSAKAIRWSDAARNFAGASASRRVVRCAGTINPLSPDDGTKRARQWADTEPKPAAA